MSFEFVAFGMSPSVWEDVNRASNCSTKSSTLCSGLLVNVGRTIVGSLRDAPFDSRGGGGGGGFRTFAKKNNSPFSIE